MRAVAILCVLATTATVDAQSTRPGFEFTDFTSAEPIGAELADVRLSHNAERRDAGIVLLSGGLASAIGGGVVGGVLHDDPFWLSFGLGTAAWGAINAALAFGMLDLGGGRERAIEADRNLHGDELARARERAIRDQLDTATIFAVNFGLDVFYIASGILLFFVADRLDSQQDRELLRGYSIAMTAQGGFLLGFDLVEWIASVGRADRLAHIPIPR